MKMDKLIHSLCTAYAQADLGNLPDYDTYSPEFKMIHFLRAYFAALDVFRHNKEAYKTLEFIEKRLDEFDAE